MTRWLPLSLALLALGLASVGRGADWPQYRCDASRSASSSEQLPEQLQLQWVRHLPAPKPAFPGEVRLWYDATYEPVVMGRTMFVPSMVSDSVTALDTETGAKQWQFFAEGPVRFAPVAWQGAVYFVSDDGYLYCVEAADGKLRWKFHGLPPGKKDRKLLGSGRLISLYPARGGPVLHEGVLYFAAGLWSTYGVAIHAVDAASGRVIWSNTDSNKIPKANQDHGIAHYAGLTPQGYLAVVGEKLVVPCGPQLPAFLDLKTGALGTYCMGWGGRNGLPKGTWFVAGAGNYLSHGGDLYDISRPNDERFAKPPKGPDFKAMLYAGAFTRVHVDPTNQKDLGAFGQPVFASGVMYHDEQGIVASDLGSARLEERSAAEAAKSQPDDPFPDKWKAAFRELWRLPSKLRVHVRAGEHLYLGGDGAVEAVRIPQQGEPPRVVWRAPVEGTPHRLLAADGKLFVVTRQGAILAFGGQKPANPLVHPAPAPPAPPADAWTKTAAEILQATGVRDGYALVLGLQTGRLVEELIRQSDLDVIAIDPDADKVAGVRRRLHAAGRYGARASVHVGDPLAYPLSPFLASLVVSEDWAALGPATGGKLLPAVFHALRPYGGTACLALPAAQRDAVAGQVAESRLAGATARAAGDWLLISRAGPLPGAADWSHAEADAANTGASEDAFVKAPLDLLWFDTPPRWVRTPGATLVRITGGRMFLKAQRLRAVDVFTGRTLWETSPPFSHSPNDQMVAAEDAIYLTGGKTCCVLDPATGREVARIELPSGLTAPWSNLRVWKDFLVGQSGQHLVCVNRLSGQVTWQFQCGRPHLSVAVGGGKVFCAELLLKRRGESETQESKTRALDLATGKVLWEMPGGSEVRYSPTLDLVVMSSGIYRANDGTRVAGLPEATGPAEQPKPENAPKPLFVVGQTLLMGTAESFAIHELPTGRPSGHTTVWVRRGCTIPRASANLLTTRFRGNAACIDLATRQIVPFWNVRAACSNNLFPADGLLNMPSLTGGCTCNYLPVSQAFAPAAVIPRPGQP